MYYFGHGTTGDETVLTSILETGLRTVNPKAIHAYGNTLRGLDSTTVVWGSGTNQLFEEEKDLKIVNIMSSAALRGNKQESVYCATKWGEKGYTESLKACYKGTSVQVIGVYPGGINTNFYKDSRDYVSEEKQNSFMSPKDVAKTILDNTLNETNLTVADIIIERNS